MKSIVALSLLLSLACAGSSATMRGSGGDVKSCGDLLAAVVPDGATVFTRPDNTSATVVIIDKDTPVCAGSENVGFAFRRVKLGDGREGFVQEKLLNLP